MRKIIIILCTIGMLALLLASCKQTIENSSMDKKSVSDAEVPSEIIIRLEQGANLEVILQALEPYGLKTIRTIAPNPPMYLVTYNTSTIKPEEILSKIKAHPQVRNAEFNKKISDREK